jgi:hypothetical protein
MNNKSKNKNKKRLLILVALVGVMGIGGVVAATSISINGGVPISLGAGYTTATTCDSAVTITAGQGYNTGTNLYEVNALNIADVNIASGACNNKVMQLAVVGTMAGSPIQASWTLASSALTTAIYQLGATGNGSVSGVYHNASTALAPFDIATLSTVALSIS